MGITKLGYVGLDVEDAQGWTDLFEGTLGVGFTRVGEGSSATLLAELDEYQYRLALYPAAKNATRHLGWIVDSAVELDRLTARLAQAGYAVEQASAEEIDLRGAVALRWFIDPVGNRVELALGEKKARVAAARASDASPGTVGLGHFVLASPKLAEMRELYEAVLEFTLTDYRSPGLFFLRCNSTHHSIALASANETMIHHLEIEQGGIDDVGCALDRAQENGAPISISLGRHMNDKAISFYLENPSGFHLEIGCGGIEIGDDWTPHDFGRADVWGHRHAKANPFAVNAQS